MTSRMKKWEVCRYYFSSSLVLILTALSSFAATDSVSVPLETESGMRFIQIEAKNKEDRTAIANLGVSIEAVRSDSVWGFANSKEIERLRQTNHKILGNFDLKTARGGHENLFSFPPGDSRFHNYEQNLAALKELQTRNSDITRLQSIGKSVEGRDIWAIHINTTQEALEKGASNKPGAIFMGAHHAREHVSVEIPLMLAQHLMNKRRDPHISALLDTRDIWIVPMVNPDGAEFDISTNSYQWWRKNRKDNKDGSFGVDLNRNYGFKWGTGGSDKDTSSEVYMGSAPFSEPETQAVRDFVNANLNTKVLITFHTYSELILYPWGHTYDGIGNAKDLAAFQKMAKTMANWNHYTPEQSSQLYIASGDTTDWAYGEHGIFAFTFELSPRDMWNGGFYPGAGVIDKVFQDNLQPCLYLMDMAGDPYKVLDDQPIGWLKNYVEPRVSESFMWNPQVREMPVK